MNHLQAKEDVLPDRPYTPVGESEDDMVMFIPIPNPNGSIDHDWVELGSEVVGGKEYVKVSNRYDFDGRDIRRYTRQELSDARIAADRERDARRQARETEPVPIETREAVGAETVRTAERAVAIESAFNDDPWGNNEPWDEESAARISQQIAERDAAEQRSLESPQAQADSRVEHLRNLQATRMTHSPVVEAAPAASVDKPGPVMSFEEWQRSNNNPPVAESAPVAALSPVEKQWLKVSGSSLNLIPGLYAGGTSDRVVLAGEARNTTERLLPMVTTAEAVEAIQGLRVLTQELARKDRLSYGLSDKDRKRISAYVEVIKSGLPEVE